MADDSEFTTRQKVALGVFLVPMALLSRELVPGWGFLKLGWPPAAYYAVMAACGGVAGWLFARRRSWLGAVCGAMAAYGSLLAQAWHLGGVSRTRSSVLFFFAALGALPGIILYFAAGWFLSRGEQGPPPESGPPASQ